jgi:N-methylhydantoinase B
MNNLTLGGWDPFRTRRFAYYETIGGGAGASISQDGASAVQTHMTNTLNTPVEALEFYYPLRVRQYSIREASGGAGEFKGGDGIQRELEILAEVQATILSERRKTSPYGLAGGKDGKPGKNVLLREEQEQILPGKGSFVLLPGDILRISTPGGGGYGNKAPSNVPPE